MKTGITASASACFLFLVATFGLVASSAFATPTLIDIAFTSTLTPKVGFAGTGLTSNDFWNTYAENVNGVAQTSGATPNLEFVNGTPSGAGLTVANVGGGNGDGVADPMYQAYLYPLGGGNITMTVTNLSAGSYDFYFYGHGNQNNQNCVFQLTVGATTYPTEATLNGAGWDSPVWQEGVQYVEFTNIPVGAGQTVTILDEPGAGGIACISGVQIASAGAATPGVTANSQNLAVAENTSTPITLSGVSSDNGPVTYTVLTQPTNGTLTGTPPNLSYLPATNFTGSDSFTFQANEGSITSAVASVSISIVPTTIAEMIDVAFTSELTPKVGFAATGMTSNDFWNTYAQSPGGVLRTSAVVTNLEFVNGNTSSVGMAVTNASGGNGNGASDPMYEAYLYGVGGGNISLTITNLTAGLYDFYFYGHGNVNNQNSVFQLTVGTANEGSEATLNGAGWNSSVWQEGVQYVEFTNVSVPAGQTITVQVEPGAGGYACLSGLQIGLLTVSTNGAPTILQSPASQTVDTGTNVSFGALAGGSPSSVQWYFTNALGTNLVGTSIPLLVTANDGTAGGYEAVFSNSFGMATTAVAVLSVLDPPSIITSPLSQAASAGTQVTFTASASGISNTMQWYFINYLGTNAVAGATSTTLKVTANGLTAGSYYAVFHNALGSAATSAASLGVLGLPFVNGGFETNTNGAVIPAGTGVALSPGATWMQGWTVGGPGNDLAVIDGTDDGLSPYDGKQWIDFHWYGNAPGGTLAQTFTTTVGQTYLVAFEVSQLRTGGSSLTAKAYGPNNSLLASNYCVPPTPLVWTQFQLNFVALSTNTTLLFTDTSASGSPDLNFDTVTVSNAPSTGVPVVLQSPISQTVNTGTQVSFGAVAGGSLSSIQWYVTNSLGTNLITGGTNSPLLVTANDGSAGGYEAVFSNSFGMATTAVAVLSVIDPPGIITSPLSETANAGTQVTFTASASGTSDTVQWYFINYLGTNAVTGATSSNLQITASGPTAGSYYAVFHNVVGSAATSPASLGVLGLPFVNGGFETNTNGAVIPAGTGVALSPGATWMQGWTVGGPGNDVAVIDGTDDGLSPYDGNQWIDFHWYSNPSGGTLAQTFTTTVGQTYTVTFEVSELRTGGPSLTAMAFSTSEGVLSSNYCVPPTPLVWAQFELSFVATTTNSTLFFKDTSASGTPDLNFDAVAVISPPTIVTNPVSQTVTNGNSVTFTAAASGNSSTVQWWNNVTNLVPNGTNTTLTFTASPGSGGYYSAVFSNAAGTATTTAALLTVDNPVFLTQQPQSVTTNLGANVTFTGAAGGGTPINLQWQFDGTNIVGATNADLVVSDVQLTNAGNYVLLATNAYGWAASSNAVLSIVSTLQVVSTNVAGASTVTVPVNLIATGNESVATFSLDFDPTVLTFMGITPGSGASGAAFTPNTNQAASGHIGLLVGYVGGNFSAGTQAVAQATFAAVLATNTVATTISFGGSPTSQKIIDASFDQLAGAYLAGTVTVTPTSLEGDVWPRPNGNYVLDANDWLQEGRFVVGLDTVSNASEMQRADCAPRSVSGGAVTSGDGEINALDLAQAGRYVVGLDPLTAMAGPDLGSSGSVVAKAKGVHSNAPGQAVRTLSLVPMTNVANAVTVQLRAAGDENTVDFSLAYDPTMASFVSATPGAGTTGALFVVNSNTPGKLGIALALQPGQTFPAGTNNIVQLDFNPVDYSNTVALVFTNSPAQCSVSDPSASTSLPTTYQNGSLVVGGTVWPTLNIGTSGANISLSWPATATNFTVQMTTNLTAAWSAAGGTTVTNGATISITLPAPTNSTFYRLSQP